MLDGEAKVLTEAIIRMTTITGTLEEVAETIRGLQAAGLNNLTLNPSRPVCREIMSEAAEKLMPLVETTSQPHACAPTGSSRPTAAGSPDGPPTT